MRSIFGYFLVLSMLIMNMEAFIDVQLLGHSHDGEQSHSLNVSSINLDDSGQSDTSDNDFCGHCCHGHSNSIVSKNTGFSVASHNLETRIDPPSQFKDFTQRPPTPPPNA